MENNYIKKNRKGQVWTVDFIAGLVLFILVLVLTVKITVSMTPTDENNVLHREAIHISDSLINEGYPTNWTIDDVIVPGIGLNNRINDTKLALYKNLSYEKTKALYGMSGEYIFFFENDSSIINIKGCVIGYNITVNTTTCQPMLDTIIYDDLSKIERAVIYENNVLQLVIYVWN